MANPYNVEGLVEQADDIISSGYEFSEWHKKQLTKLFREVPQDLRKEFVETYYADDTPPEGVSSEELQFMAEMLNVAIVMEFIPED